MSNVGIALLFVTLLSIGLVSSYLVYIWICPERYRNTEKYYGGVKGE